MRFLLEYNFVQIVLHKDEREEDLDVIILPRATSSKDLTPSGTMTRIWFSGGSYSKQHP